MASTRYVAVRQKTDVGDQSVTREKLAPEVAAAVDSATNADEVISIVQGALGVMPTVPGLFAHWKADAITGVTSGTRIASWADSVSAIAAAQADTAKQPAYIAGAINGKPALQFDTARGDALVANPVTPTSLAATVFVVCKRTPIGSGSRYVFGTNGSGTNPKNLYFGAGAAGMQAFLAGQTVDVETQAQIIGGVFQGETSELRVNGVGTATNIGTAAVTLNTAFTIGHRHAQTAGNGYGGLVAEVMFYDRVLTPEERGVVERYLSAKYGIPITRPTTLYIDSVAGNDANYGRTIDSPMKTLGTAMAVSKSRYLTDVAWKVNAPVDAPFREVVINDVTANSPVARTIRVSSITPGARWHHYASIKVTSGWTALGGGVYSHPMPTGLAALNVHCVVMDQRDVGGYPLAIRDKDLTAPTAPAAGKYGLADGTYYLHLPDGSDPNTHVIEIAQIQGSFVTHGAGSKLYLENGDLFGGYGRCVQSGISVQANSGGWIEATSCTASYASDSGFNTTGYSDGMRCIDCRAHHNGNDGFNHHGAAGVATLMELINCEGDWNDDEGFSPHDDTVYIVRGGRYHHNGSGGITAVAASIGALYAYNEQPVEIYRNRRLYGAGGDSGGLVLTDTAKLTVYDAYIHDNPGPGVSRSTGTTLTVAGTLRSGTDNGNGAADLVV